MLAPPARSITRRKRVRSFYDVDNEGRIVGIEILDASKVLAPGDWQDARRPGATSVNAAE